MEDVMKRQLFRKSIAPATDIKKPLVAIGEWLGRIRYKTSHKYLGAVLAAGIAITGSGLANAQTANKPNILILWGDDIGYWNVSAYNQGMMGYKTPNIDRIAKEARQSLENLPIPLSAIM
jgi:hypothetical protein